MQLPMVLSRIYTCPLPSPLRSKVIRTAASLALRGTRTSRRPTVNANVCDYKVSASSWGILRMLFGEIFLRPTYYFEATTKTPLIVDCGSNIGLSILFFKSIYPGARIIGFEPAPQAFELLQQNLKDNQLEDVEIHQLALGAEESTISFFVDPAKSASPRASTIESRLVKAEEIEVRQARLSSFLDGEVDLLKLDVEGAEDSVLEDLASSGAIRRIRQMIIEYHHHIEPDRDSLSSFLSRLEEHGFGYTIDSALPRKSGIPQSRRFQDVTLFAYRKN